MDMKQLMTFTTLSRTLNYQKAAEQLQYAPSTLFKHVQLLEQELGAPLLCKTGRQLHLTAEGERFVEHANRILEDYHHALESISGDDGKDQEITIGGCEINTANSLLCLLTQFSKKYPKVRMSMVTSSNASIPGMIRSDMIDLGYFYSVGRRTFPGMQTVCLYREPVYLMASQGNPIAARRHLVYEDLAQMSFVHPHDNCCFVLELMPRLRKRGVCFRKNTYLGGVQLVVEHAHEENALMLIPQCAIERFTKTYGMVKLDMDEEPIFTMESIVYKNAEALSPVAKALLAHSIRYAQRMVASDSDLIARQMPENSGELEKDCL